MTAGMDPVAEQYETFPYPARDPGAEATRLIEGSPSHPVEIDHFLFAGRRDWGAPFRALVAGGGTGDGLVMLAQKLADIGCPAEITYLDLSRASRAVAEARVAARGLASVRFVTGDLLSAPGLGPFDYIDCCGVLHHLPDPDAGFAALAAALAPEGGIGLMVYAPYGRTGVYPLQEAFATLLAGDPPGERVRLARQVLEALPPTNWLTRNPFVGDHRDGDAGLYDLLLHARDRAYGIEALLAALSRAKLGLAGVVEAARYEPQRYLPQHPDIAERLRALSPPARMGLAERLAGNIKTHVLYAAHGARAPKAMAPASALAPRADGVAHLTVPVAKLARRVAEAGVVTLTLDGLEHRLTLAPPGPAGAAARARAGAMIAALDGRRTLGAVWAAGAQRGGDEAAARQAWAGIEAALRGFNLLHFSARARR